MTSFTDPSVQAALLQDPQVQDAVKRAGQQALSDPKVQQQILDTCCEKFPDVANDARENITKWANDPEVQAQVQEYAGFALDHAKEGAAQAASEFVNLIEQGPAGIRILAFVGSCASCCNALITLLGLLNPLTWVTGLVSYVVCGYQVIFALTTMLFEAPPEYIEKVPLQGINDYQDLLLQKAKFLSEVGGRGLFYIFQGSLWLAFASKAEIVDLAVGLYFVLVGGFHVAMHFGIMPQEIAQKARQGMKGYIPLPSPRGTSVSERSLELSGAKREDSDESTTDASPAPSILSGPAGPFRGRPGALPMPFRASPPSVSTPGEQHAAEVDLAFADSLLPSSEATEPNDAAAEHKQEPDMELPTGKKGASCCVVS